MIQLETYQAEKILLENYGIIGFAQKLPGEIDANFKIETAQKTSYVLKISRAQEDIAYLDLQQKLLQYADKSNPEICVPEVVLDIKGRAISTFEDENGQQRSLRLLSWIPGRLWSSVIPQLDELRFGLGLQCGNLTAALQGFTHQKALRNFDWDLAQALWVKEHVHLFTLSEKECINYFLLEFKSNKKAYDVLRKSLIHNDANDNNIVVSEDLITPKVKALIDYGDAVYSQIINDVAIACAYAIMHHKDPLTASIPVVKGYHSAFKLAEEELDFLYNLIGIRLVISVCKSAINKIKEPNNDYLLISEKPAWELLYQWKNINKDFASYQFRAACNYNAHPKEAAFQQWALNNSFSLVDVFPSIQKNKIHPLDLSVSSKWIGHEYEFNDLDLFEYKLQKLQKKHPDAILAGGYLEPRPLYTSTDFDSIGNNGRMSRTIHLGVDYWLPEKTPIHAFLDGEVVVANYCEGFKNYGGLIILKHQTSTFDFYSLYGHLSKESIEQIKKQQKIKKGGCIGYLGNQDENGSWATHLHFQLMLSLLGFENDFPGVAYHQQIEVWKSICPDPDLLFKTNKTETKVNSSNKELIDYRKQHLGKSLSLQYKVPIKMVRGAGVYLMDEHGTKYLDTVNNVAHVGHEHHAVVNAGQEQMALINTNTRYLHENINALAKELLKTLPKELSVLHFVNSGSEANELALRMAKTFTGQKDIIASEVGYHGNTNACIDISSYKFDGKGGSGAPEYTQIFPLPDAYRGAYKGSNTAENYSMEVGQCIEKIQKKGRNVAAFIIEPIISCGGQIELPEGFLEASYQKIRAAGGLCISDEVQTGCGRMGKTYWGFQLHGVVPDIVTIGKPLGNGHPIAAVACTQEVADKFANGMEFFNTFGGNPVSCAIATEVLKTVEREQLQKNALAIGDYLKSELNKLAMKFTILGDVRGQGLFLGIELVDSHQNPMPNQTEYLLNRMKEHGILMSSDGPDHNVLKIKPPLVFSRENAEELLSTLEKILKEDYMRLSFK